MKLEIGHPMTSPYSSSRASTGGDVVDFKIGSKGSASVSLSSSRGGFIRVGSFNVRVKELCFADILINSLGPSLGLIINVKKTEYFSAKDGASTKECSLVGTWIGSYDKAVKENISKAWAYFGALRKKVWSQKKTSFEAKVKIFKAICIPSPLYGLETLLPLSDARTRGLNVSTLNMFAFQGLKAILELNYFSKGSSPREC
jgi:hypothetical protein